MRESCGRRTLATLQIPIVKSLYGLASLHGLQLSGSGQVSGAILSFGQQVMRMGFNQASHAVCFYSQPYSVSG